MCALNGLFEPSPPEFRLRFIIVKLRHIVEVDYRSLKRTQHNTRKC
jgi:hypothetical protein